ncbi:hypothetical protein GTY86_14785 [Streptomyces sp. SID5770]|uniref:hypothetical protein n=1 Tax=Streptomyces sp. SID5770 TaxID=2690308 RepID=UPI00136B55E6|nr:hypothetical protein [Streptomyces sp. SID5770]
MINRSSRRISFTGPANSPASPDASSFSDVRSARYTWPAFAAAGAAEDETGGTAGHQDGGEDAELLARPGAGDGPGWAQAGGDSSVAQDDDGADAVLEEDDPIALSDGDAADLNVDGGRAGALS